MTNPQSAIDNDKIDENARPWVDGLTMPQVLRETARRYPDNDALAFPALGLRVSYREFSERVDDAARGLAALGIKHGEHVAIWATNVPEWVVLQFATARLGAVLVNINPAYRPFELKYVLNQSDSVALPTHGRIPASRGASCEYSGAPAACPLTDGKLSTNVFSTSQGAVSVITITFASPKILTKAVLRNLSEIGRAHV